MSLFLCSLLHNIFPSCWLGWLKLVILNYISRILDYVFGFVGALRFCVSLEMCLDPMQVSIVMWDSGMSFPGIVYFCAPLSLHSNIISLRVPFPLRVHLYKLTAKASNGYS